MSDLTDIQLIALVREGKEEYASELYQRYQKRAKKIASEYYYANRENGIPFEEYYSRAFAAIETSIRKYDVSRAESMYSYWRKIAVREIIHLMNNESYFNGGRGFYGLSLDTLLACQDNDDLTLGEKLCLEEPRMDESNTLLESLLEIISDPKNKFTNRERQILLLQLDGEDKDSIVSLLKIKKSTYYTHLEHGYQKLKKILEKENNE